MLDPYSLNSIELSGLPLSYIGWNVPFAYFMETNDMNEGAPIYRLKPYKLGHLIPIAGAKIMKVNGIWSLMRNDSNKVLFRCPNGLTDHNCVWENGITSQCGFFSSERYPGAYKDAEKNGNFMRLN